MLRLWMAAALASSNSNPIHNAVDKPTSQHRATLRLRWVRSSGISHRSARRIAAKTAPPTRTGTTKSLRRSSNHPSIGVRMVVRRGLVNDRSCFQTGHSAYAQTWRYKRTGPAAGSGRSILQFRPVFTDPRYIGSNYRISIIIQGFLMRIDVLGFCVISLFVSTCANAQFSGLLSKRFGLPSRGEVGGSYQSNNQIRTYIMSDPHDNLSLYDKLIIKASKMAADRGFSRIGVTKESCTTAVIAGTPRSTSCYVIAVMLNEQETTKSRGDREVQYYSVKTVNSGMIAPLPASRY
ncbi:hypothetical protein ACVKSY_003080 [Sphingomonas sp. PvP107]